MLRARLLRATALVVLVSCRGPERVRGDAVASPSLSAVGASRDAGPATPAAMPELAALPGPCPGAMALVGGRFCIDRWEAITVSPDETQHSPYDSVAHEKVRAASRPGVIPQAYISIEEADAACRRSGKRVCTTKQWVDACRGTEKPFREYPYGSKKVRGACNTFRRYHPMMLLFDGHRREDSWSLNDPRINRIAATVAPTGAFERCVTPDGVHDLHGNLHEWTRGERPLLMGGYYLDGSHNGEGCSYVTIAHGPRYHDFSTGFRCCKAVRR